MLIYIYYTVLYCSLLYCITPLVEPPIEEELSVYI